MTPVVARGVREPVEQVPQPAEPLELPRLDRRPRGRRRPDGHQRQQVLEAQRRSRATASAQAGSAVSPTRLSDAAGVRPGDALAGRAGGRPRGLGRPAGRGSSPGRRSPPRARGGAARASRAAGSPRRGCPARRRSASRTAAGVPAAEPARGVERLAEPDVVDALGEDRLEVGGLGALPLAAQRAAGRAERVGEVDVGARADRQAPHGGSPRRPGHRHGAIVAHRAVCCAGAGDDGTGWVWDLPVMFRRVRRDDSGPRTRETSGAMPRATPRHRRPDRLSCSASACGALPVAAAGSSAKVVIVVGPVGDHNAHYKADAGDIAAEARRHTPNVVEAVHAQRDLGRRQGRRAGRERVRLPRPRQRLAEHLPAVPDADQGRPRARPVERRRRLEARLLRRGLHPEQHPVRAQRRRAAVPPVLRVGEHRARAAAGHVRRGPGARRQLRRRVHRRRARAR